MLTASGKEPICGNASTTCRGSRIDAVLSRIVGDQRPRGDHAAPGDGDPIADRGVEADKAPFLEDYPTAKNSVVRQKTMLSNVSVM